MPRINFDNVEESVFEPVPSGDYEVVIDSIDEKTTEKGNEMWRLTLKITAGEQQGMIVHDNLVFSERALVRIKHLCKAIGISVEGEVDLIPDMFYGKKVRVLVGVEEYNYEGKVGTRNKVAFAGYSPAGVDSWMGKQPEPPAEEVTDEDVPF